jgi:hypothetical protein
VKKTSTQLRWRDERWPLLAIASVLTATYGFTMTRTVTLEDAGAFISVATFGGIAHPPGYPLYTLLAALFAQLPLDSVAQRVQLFSAVSAAGACCCVYLCARLLGARRAPSFVAAMALGLSDTFWSQAIVAEVYALNAFFTFLVLALCLRLDDVWSKPWLRFTAFALGLGLANHWPLMLLGGPGFVAVLARPGQIRERATGLLRDSPALLACFACGLLPYLYLPIRSAYAPEMMAYGPVSSLSELASYIARSHFAEFEQGPTAGVTAAFRFVALFFSQITREFSWAGTPFLVAGFLASFRYLPAHRAVALALGCLSSSVLLKLIHAVDYDAMTEEAYLIYQAASSFGAAALYLACAFFWLERARRWRRALTPALAVLLLVPCALRSFERNDQRHQSFASDYARALLEPLPRDAVLLAYGDADLGPLAYAHHIEGIRPDIRLYSQLGNLFSNRLFLPLESNATQARAALGDLVRAEGRVFLTWDAMGLLQSQAFRGHNHGPIIEIVARPSASYEMEREDLKERLGLRARFFLDHAWESFANHREAIRHSYLWEGITAGFCDAVLRQGASHPIVPEIPRCGWRQAQLAWQEGDLDRAAKTYRDLLHAPGFQLFEEQALYREYLQLELARIHAAAAPWSAEPAVYQRLADAVLPAVAAQPSCSNPTLLGLLQIRGEVEIDIDLPALRARFGACPALRPLLEAEPSQAAAE